MSTNTEKDETMTARHFEDYNLEIIHKATGDLVDEIDLGPYDLFSPDCALFFGGLIAGIISRHKAGESPSGIAATVRTEDEH